MIKAALDENNALVKSETAPRMIGEIKYFAMNTPPSHCLACDGSAVSRTTYAALFAAIGTTWGAGDGSRTFNLPDLRDVWILCAGTEHEAGDSVAEGLPNILGWVPSTNILTDNTSYKNHEGEASWNVTGGAFTTTFSTHQALQEITEATRDQIFTISFNASNDNAIYGASQHVTPKSKALKACIIYE